MKFIFKILKFIFTILIAFIVFTFLFSLKNNMSFGSTLTYLKTIGSEILNINNSQNVLADSYNEVIMTSTNNHYYYDQLDDTGKVIYSALENNIDNLKKENYTIDFTTTFNDLLNTTTGQYKLNKAFQSALDAFFYDHPELFYLDLTNFSLNTKCISIGSIKTYAVEIVPKNNSYLCSDFKSEDEVKIAIKQVENIKNDIVNTVTDKNVYNKIKEVHDILVNTIEYDASLNKANTYNIYGALIKKQVVCEGYAKAFKYIMDNLDIECILVSGVATNSSGKQEAHMWNYVKLNDAWYGVDVTWDDPIIVDEYIKDNLRHTYLLKGKSSLLSSHNPNGKISDTGMLFTLPTLSTNDFKN